MYWQVLIQENSYVRILTLNRPKQLNALSFQMVCYIVHWMPVDLVCHGVYIFLPELSLKLKVLVDVQ